MRGIQLREDRKSAVAVCGPTASGKSRVADRLAEVLTRELGTWVTTLVVDSMQVYRELPVITNQERQRRAELVGITSILDEWTVARHKREAEKITCGLRTPFVLDAGTGMYLNAILMDIDIAPKAPPEARRAARKLAVGSQNPRRSTREIELQMMGARKRGSIWDGELLYDTALIYLRPQRALLDDRIAERSKKIAALGVQEAENIRDIVLHKELRVNPSVLDSIGVKELLGYVTSGEPSLPEAEKRIATRTRQMARRQLRWFDKLARKLDGRADILIFERPEEAEENPLDLVRGKI